MLIQNMVSSAEVIGKTVKSTTLENLGKIIEIILDKKSGQAQYVIVPLVGFLGFSGEYFAFPWHYIKYNIKEDCFILVKQTL